MALSACESCDGVQSSFRDKASRVDMVRLKTTRWSSWVIRALPQEASRSLTSKSVASLGLRGKFVVGQIQALDAHG